MPGLASLLLSDGAANASLEEGTLGLRLSGPLQAIGDFRSKGEFAAAIRALVEMLVSFR